MKSNKKSMPKPPFEIRNVSNKVPEELPPEHLLQNAVSEKSQKEISKYLFDPSLWLNWWKQHKNDVANKRGMRIMVQIGTIEACLRGKYYLPNGNIVHLNKKELESASTSSKMYTSDYKFEKFQATFQKTEIQVINGDCLEAAIWLMKKHKTNPAVLNMASSSHPNGGYRSGSGAQEENLTRRTNLFQCLDDPYLVDKHRSWNYPIPEFGGIYSKDVVVFRRGESYGYAFMEVPQKVSIISAAGIILFVFFLMEAYSNPPTEEQHGKLILTKKIANHMKHKISSILNIALENGHKSIVLSAFGCGAYGNPTEHIAELFKEVIKSMDGCFSHVLFAIFDDHNTNKGHNPEGNVVPFSKVFNCEAIPLEKLLNEETNGKEEVID